MTGFEPRTSGIGSDLSTNWATTTSHQTFFIKLQSFTNVSWNVNNLWDLERNYMPQVTLRLKLILCWNNLKKSFLFASLKRYILLRNMRQ